MAKQRQTHQQRAKHGFTRVVKLAPARESRTPFCAYYGPQGERCPCTTNLEPVFMLPGPPTCIYLACPLHYTAVQRMVQAFLARIAHGAP